MANDAVLQVRIDAQLKRDVEQLYRSMGTTFSEAVRMFARQSLLQGRMPFYVSSDASLPEHLPKRAKSACSPATFASTASISANLPSGFGMLASYADEQKRGHEARAWREAAGRKHGALKTAPTPTNCEGDAS